MNAKRAPSAQREVRAPKCLDRNKRGETLVSGFSSPGGWVLFAGSRADKFLDALRTQGSLWKGLRSICKDDNGFESEAEYLIATSLETLAPIFSKERERFASLTRKEKIQRTAHVRNLARELSAAIYDHPDLWGISSGSFWIEKDFQHTIAKSLAGRELEIASAILRSNAPRIASLLDRLEIFASEMTDEYRATKALRASRKDAKRTRFMKAICAYLLDRFPSQGLARLGSIASSITAAAVGDPHLDLEEAALQCAQRLRMAQRARQP